MRFVPPFLPRALAAPQFGVRGLAAVLALLGPISVGFAQASDSRTTTVGGPGGSQFESPCPPGTVMIGLNARHGDWVDALAPICSTWVHNSRALGEIPDQPAFTGGRGGGPGFIRCQGPRGVVVGLEVSQAANRDGSVGHVFVRCGDYEHPEQFANKLRGSAQSLGNSQRGASVPTPCPPGMVAAGIYGHSGAFIDRVGLLCTPALRSAATTKLSEVPRRTAGLGKRIAARPGRTAASRLYAIQGDGRLMWYRHLGATDGTFDWEGPKEVGTGWAKPKSVFTGGGGVVYLIENDGRLMWYRHVGAASGTFEWEGPKEVGTGWQRFKNVFAAGNRVVYAIQEDGRLMWYRHVGAEGGTFEWEGPKEVGTGWQGFKDVFAGSDGALYAIERDGRLMWYRHLGAASGTFEWEGPKEVGTGWQDFENVFPGSGGIVYAIREDGKLLWYRHTGAAGGTFEWEGPSEVGTGWEGFRDVLGASLP